MNVKRPDLPQQPAPPFNLADIPDNDPGWLIKEEIIAMGEPRLHSRELAIQALRQGIKDKLVPVLQRVSNPLPGVPATERLSPEVAALLADSMDLHTPTGTTRRTFNPPGDKGRRPHDFGESVLYFHIIGADLIWPAAGVRARVYLDLPPSDQPFPQPPEQSAPSGSTPEPAVASASATPEPPADQTSQPEPSGSSLEPAPTPATPEPKPAVAGKKMSLRVATRKLKLGDDYDRLLSTSLGSPKELDALIHWKEHHPDVCNALIARAVVGEPVSAINALAKLNVHGGLDAVRKELAPPPNREPVSEQDPRARIRSSRKPRKPSAEEECAIKFWGTRQDLLKPNVDWWSATKKALEDAGHKHVNYSTAKYWRKSAGKPAILPGKVSDFDGQS